jgi:hypothetical protein
LEVLKRNAEYKTHFQIQSNSGVIILSCQKRDPNVNGHPLLPSKSGPNELNGKTIQSVLKEKLREDELIRGLSHPIVPIPNFVPMPPRMKAMSQEETTKQLHL